ncbi:hypothetical protein SDC9_22965 [bioreactor metagenome]|uniref:Threonine efflux protein n=1 Tax=bioreactor metagenome TaxID=1076179 RepID=A0A644UDY6_9ZZZZ|nr:LysE family transporter [Negativicutes bacterium]
MGIAVLAKGIIIGFSIAAPVGPIGILCIRRTLIHGMLTGLVSGVGAASADAIYGVIAAFGLTIISNFLLEQQFWLRIIGGLFLLYLAYTSFKAPVVDDGRTESCRGLLAAYLSTFFLTIANPMTILSFVAVFAGLGLGSESRDCLSAGCLVLGVFLGSIFWWMLLSKTVDILRTRFDSRKLGWVNKTAGIVIGLFGLAAMLSGLRL